MKVKNYRNMVKNQEPFDQFELKYKKNVYLFVC